MTEERRDSDTELELWFGDEEMCVDNVNETMQYSVEEQELERDDDNDDDDDDDDDDDTYASFGTISLYYL